MNLLRSSPLIVCALLGCANKPAKPEKSERRPASVVTTRAIQKDMPLMLDGLGTVTAYRTVTVRSQVDGRLMSVNFREGQAVKKGELLAQIDARNYEIQLRQAQAAHARDSAQLRNAGVNLERYANVGKDKLIAQQQVDDQQALVQQLDGQVKADLASMDQARLLIDYARIRSPIDGVVGVRLIDPGNFVRAAEAGGIVVVTQVDPISVLFTLPADELPRVRQAMAAGQPKVQALSRDGAAALAEGTLEVIDNQINTATATIRLKATFANPDKTLWPNQFVKTRLYLGTRKDALVVPAVAIQRGPDGAFVYVVSDDKKAVNRAVEVESLENDWAVIRKGLAVGETVVTEGQYQLKPGAPVEPREPAVEGDKGKGKGKKKADATP
jgi:multidrug efflux system membrane fusion protein